MASYGLGVGLTILPAGFITWAVHFLPIWIAIWAIVGYLVYLDAKNRGLNAFGWFLFVLIFFIIGLITYVLVRSDASKGRPMPVLVVMLVASFVLMLFSGILFMAGLPEAVARALFLATVVIWTGLGVWAIVDGQLETRRFAAAQATAKANTKADAKPKEKTDEKAEAVAGPKPDAKVTSETPSSEAADAQKGP